MIGAAKDRSSELRKGTGSTGPFLFTMKRALGLFRALSPFSARFQRRDGVDRIAGVEGDVVHDRSAAAANSDR